MSWWRKKKPQPQTVEEFEDKINTARNSLEGLAKLIQDKAMILEKAERDYTKSKRELMSIQTEISQEEIKLERLRANTRIITETGFDVEEFTGSN